MVMDYIQNNYPMVREALKGDSLDCEVELNEIQDRIRLYHDNARMNWNKSKFYEDVYFTMAVDYLFLAIEEAKRYWHVKDLDKGIVTEIEID